MNAKIYRSTSGRLYLADDNHAEISPILFKYIRDKKNRAVGVVVALKLNDDIRFGYAKCHPKKEKYDKDRGFEVAVGRALKRDDLYFPFSNGLNLPPGVKSELEDIYYRSRNYFKVLPRQLEDLYR
jgi:hypothetical protein